MREDEIAKMTLEEEKKKGAKNIHACKNKIRKCIDTVSAFIFLNTLLGV